MIFPSTSAADLTAIPAARRPNVGKSTLINALLNDSSRLVVSPRAHTTRDSITVDFRHEGRAMKLIDTAGLVGTSGLARRKLSKLGALLQ